MSERLSDDEYRAWIDAGSAWAIITELSAELEKARGELDEQSKEVTNAQWALRRAEERAEAPLAAVRAEEREACAKALDDYRHRYGNNVGGSIRRRHPREEAMSDWERGAAYSYELPNDEETRIGRDRQLKDLIHFQNALIIAAEMPSDIEPEQVLPWFVERLSCKPPDPAEAMRAKCEAIAQAEYEKYSAKMQAQPYEAHWSYMADAAGIIADIIAALKGNGEGK